MNKLFGTKEGGAIISVILGLGFASLFAKTCKDNCTIVETAEPNIVRKKIFKVGNSCIKFEPKATECSI